MDRQKNVEASEPAPLPGVIHPAQIGPVSSRSEVRNQTDDAELVPRASVTGCGRDMVPFPQKKLQKQDWLHPMDTKWKRIWNKAHKRRRKGTRNGGKAAGATQRPPARKPATLRRTRRRQSQQCARPEMRLT